MYAIPCAYQVQLRPLLLSGPVVCPPGVSSLHSSMTCCSIDVESRLLLLQLLQSCTSCWMLLLLVQFLQPLCFWV